MLGARLVYSSRLTLLECRRAVVRQIALGSWTSAEGDAALQDLEDAVRAWTLFDLDAATLERAGAAFPMEPVRSLDAIHLATTVQIQAFAPDLALLSLDARVRENARMLGIRLVP